MFKAVKLQPKTARDMIDRYVAHIMKTEKDAPEAAVREHFESLLLTSEKAANFLFFEICDADSNEAVGHFWLERESAEVVHIANFQIEEAKQNQKYGTAALAALNKIIAQECKEAKRVTLSVEQDNTKAKRLYDKMGFVTMEQGRNEQGKPVYRMAKPLGPKKVHLREMEKPEIEAIIPGIKTEYADLMLKIGKCPSQEVANRDVTIFFNQLFPESKAHSNQRFFHIIDNDNHETVGRIWLMTDPSFPKNAHIMEIKIDETRRYQGYGEAALLETEKLVASGGIEVISLNSARANLPARALYTKLGYLDCEPESKANDKMQKRITAGAAATVSAAP